MSKKPNIYIYHAARIRIKAVSDQGNLQQQQPSQTIITSTPNGQQVTVIPASSNVRTTNFVQVSRSAIFGARTNIPEA